MELAGTVEIAASRETVWRALNDPAVLARCIDGVETLNRIEGEGDPRFEGKMNAKVGPVRATFTGQVTLTQIDAPARYVLVGEGKGGVAGHAKGEAEVTLAETGPSATQLAYKVTSSVGGKLAQLGARLIEGTARGYAETFFARLKAEVEAPAAPVPDEAAVEAPVLALVTEDARSGLSPLVWGGVLVLAVIAFLVWRLA